MAGHATGPARPFDLMPARDTAVRVEIVPENGGTRIPRQFHLMWKLLSHKGLTSGKA
jgi:hypothetical protein